MIAISSPEPLGSGIDCPPAKPLPDEVDVAPIQRRDIVSSVAIRFLQKYPESSNSDCWDHVVYVGRSHALFIRSHEKRVTFRLRPCSPPKTLTRHQFAKRMFFIRQIRQKRDLNTPSE